jgi:hypothetical protein
MDLYHLRQGLHVIASSWDYHGGAQSRVSVRGNSVRFTYSTSGSSSHRSVEDPNPIPGMRSLDLRRVRVNKDPNRLGYHLKDRLGDQRGGE